MTTPFINDPAAYSSPEEYHKERTKHLLTLGHVAIKEHEEEETLTHDEFMAFKKMFVRKQWPCSFQMKEESNEATVLWKIEKDYKEWALREAAVPSVKKEEMYNAMRLQQQLKRNELTIDEFKRFTEWNDKNFATRQWSWLGPLNDTEFKKFTDKLLVGSVRSFIANGSFESCGCVLWKGQRSNRSGVPEFRRINPEKKKRSSNPARLLYHFHREKIREGKGFVLFKNCSSEQCVNPFHYDYLTAASAHKRRRLK
jgi:hypothetical protein